MGGIGKQSFFAATNNISYKDISWSLDSGSIYMNLYLYS